MCVKILYSMCIIQIRGSLCSRLWHIMERVLPVQILATATATGKLILAALNFDGMFGFW